MDKSFYKEKQIVILAKRLNEFKDFVLHKDYYSKKVFNLLGFEIDKNLILSLKKLDTHLKKCGFNIKCGVDLIQNFLEIINISIDGIGIYNILNEGNIIEIDSLYKSFDDSFNLHLKRKIKSFLNSKEIFFLLKDKEFIYVPILNKYTNDFNNKFNGFIILKLKNKEVSEERLLFIFSLIYYKIKVWIYEIIGHYRVKKIYKSRLDELTGVLRRRYIFEKLEELLKGGDEVTVLFLDIDHFKKINDTYGHSVGDLVLKLFSTAISKSVRAGIDFVGRYGGEEFVVLIDGDALKKVDVKNLIESILNRITKNFIDLVNTSDLPKTLKEHIPTLSGGVSISTELRIDDINEKVEFLLDLADKRLYNSKKSGRNKVRLPDGTFIKVFK